MKRINQFIFLCLAACLALASCEKNELRLTQYTLPSDKAYVRFALLSPGTPAVMIKANDVKINGATTSGSAGFFPSTTNFPDYSAVAPNSTIRLSLANAGTANDSVVLFTTPLSLAANKFYSVVLADTGIDRTVFSVEDALALADSGFFRLRLINAMPKSPALHLVRIDSTSSTAFVRDTIVRDLAYKAGSAFITTSISPLMNTTVTPAVAYTTTRFRVVTTTGQIIGTATPLAAATANKRSFTLYAAGFANGTSTLAPAVYGFIYNK